MTGQRLAGKVAVVTGAAGGIGRAIAQRFAAEGAAVVAADLNLAGAKETAGIIAAAGGKAVGCRCDVSKAAEAEAAIALAVSRYGRLDVLVNNAAMFIPDGTVADIPEEDWTRTLAVNLTGPFLMSKYAIPAMRAAGGGSIIHMGSQLGSTAKAGRTWYCAAKAGVIHLARTMAVDHADDNIRVNSLSPGPVSTERIYRRYGGIDEANAKSGALTLLHRLGRPEEVADAALFLASDESSFMTGSDMLVDGGYNAR